jgi:hypothetical protein
MATPIIAQRRCRSEHARLPRLVALGIFALLAGSGGCRPSGSGEAGSTGYLDLLATAGSASVRPVNHAPDVFVVSDITIDGVTKRGFVVPRRSRTEWPIRIPAHAVLALSIGAMPVGEARPSVNATFRIGLSDRRTYETLYQRRVIPGQVPPSGVWIPVTVDLSGYAGWQWSLFYRPSQIDWYLVVSVNGPAAGRGWLPVLGTPSIRWLR